MKKLSVLFFLIIAASGLQAQPLDVPVATIKLLKTEIITKKDLQEKVAILEKATRQTLTAQQKQSLLDELVNTSLILQAAEKSGLRVNEADVINYGRSQLNVKVTDDEFKKLIEQQTGATWAQFYEGTRKSLLAQKFVLSYPKSEEVGKAAVTDAEVTAYFEENKAQFVSPDMVRVSHILFDTKVKPSGTLDQIRKRADDTQKQIADGKATFEEMVRKESDDKSSAAVNGDIGFLPRGSTTEVSQQYIALFGKDFMSAVFSLKKGEVSKVLSSNLGFHIVRVTDKLDQKFLGLNDPVNPLQPTTVREFIKLQLTSKAQQEALQKLLADIVDELKKEAEIKTFPQNF